MVSHVAELPCPVHEQGFLLEPYPANREAYASLSRGIALRRLLREGSVRPRGTVNVWSICEHLRLGPSSSLPPARSTGCSISLVCRAGRMVRLCASGGMQARAAPQWEKPA